MSLTKAQLADALRNERFPRSSQYDPEWVAENQMGPNALWMTEWLCEQMELRRGMRVLDMGCGKALSSVFLAREFGVRVWANDLWIKATENWNRVRDAGVEDRVFPLHAEARALPYAEGFFDAIVSTDTYHYFGTDNLYLEYFVKFVEPGGQIGIVVPATMRELDGEVPQHLMRIWEPDYPHQLFSFHTVQWWRRHWEQTRLVDIALADTLEDGWRHWLQSDRAFSGGSGGSEADALEADRGRYLGFVRMVARRKESGT
jgi:cyclopropane fatty-acyl-phospholipid synthase-like methyltransferase